uniref:Ndc10 domain-containing protein n=1 Tax=Mycena chlorophos TaxID=658473 RepID=A0ABQ0KZM4_MYCCL|nr:predicted protein [Mycena chlorophos]
MNPLHPDPAASRYVHDAASTSIPRRSESSRPASSLSQVYFGFAVAQYLGRYSAQKIMAITIFMRGLSVVTMTQYTNFKTVMINRFVLGVFEASVSPVFMIMTEDMGFSRTKTTLLTAVGNIILVVALVLGGLHTLNVPNARLLAETTANLICVVAAAMMGVFLLVKQSQAPFYKDANAGLLAEGTDESAKGKTVDELSSEECRWVGKPTQCDGDGNPTTRRRRCTHVFLFGVFVPSTSSRFAVKAPRTPSRLCAACPARQGNNPHTNPAPITHKLARIHPTLTAATPTDTSRSEHMMVLEVKAWRTMGPPSALASKALKFRTGTTKHTTLPLPPTIPIAPFCFDAMNNVVEYSPSPLSNPPSSVAPASESFVPPMTEEELARATKAAEDELNARSHRVRQSKADEDNKEKETAAKYRRYHESYRQWFDADQAALVAANPGTVALPALPITVAKVVVFLEYETTRPQKRTCDGIESTSTCGVSNLKLAISALEHYRFDQEHHYTTIPEAQKPLRADKRIKEIEKAAAHKETERTKKAETLKASGTRADIYTDAQHRLIASSFLQAKGPRNIWIAMRDRAMHLTQSSIAFRGDSSHALLWSDLFHCDLPVPAKGLDAKIATLAVLADQAKHNQTGRVDEHGAIRHRLVELCSVGAIALLFFAYFHVLGAPVPNFEPDFNDPDYGDYGRREWYALYLFSTSKDCKKAMSYANHRDRVKRSFEANDVDITKVTHAGRGFTAKTAREYGASADEVKALGGWSDSGSFRPCYDWVISVEAALGSAMFDARNPAAHFLARETLETPQATIDAIFPFAEEQPRHFLSLLIWLRTVLVQDCALLYLMHPNASIFEYPPFNTREFRDFAATAAGRIEQVEQEVALALRNLPQQMAQTLNASMSQVFLEQQRLRELVDTRLQHPALSSLPLNVVSHVSHNSEPPSKRRRVGQLVSPPSLESLSPSSTASASAPIPSPPSFSIPDFGADNSLPTNNSNIPALMNFDFSSSSLNSFGVDAAIELQLAGFGPDPFDNSYNWSIDLPTSNGGFEFGPGLSPNTEPAPVVPVMHPAVAATQTPSSTPPVAVPVTAVPVATPSPAIAAPVTPIAPLLGSALSAPTLVDAQRSEWTRLAAKFTDARLRRMSGWE